MVLCGVVRCEFFFSLLFSFPILFDSFFLRSADHRYFIKSLPSAEEYTLRRLLPLYFMYMKMNPNSLLSRFYSLCEVNGKMPFVVIENVFAGGRDGFVVQEHYDLKVCSFL